MKSRKTKASPSLHSPEIAARAAPASPAAKPEAMKKNGVQGEGNYQAARVFDDAERKFVASGKVGAAARAAAPKNETEQREMLAAEEEGKRRSKEAVPRTNRKE